MAIYSLNLGFISRSAGRSSVGFSAYISGGNMRDERTWATFNFSHKQDVLGGRVLAPADAPLWMADPGRLWNAVEAFEDHMANLRFRGGDNSQAAKEKFLSSAQTAQTIMGALPLEFTREQAERCVEDFLNSRFVSRGLVVQYAIHWDTHNPHFHGLITRRPVQDGVFSRRKDREIVSKAEHKEGELGTALAPEQRRAIHHLCSGPDAPHRTAAVAETTQKIDELMTAYNNAQTYDDKSFAKYNLRQEFRMLKEDPQLMADLKTLNPDMGEQLDKHMGQFFERGRGP